MKDKIRTSGIQGGISKEGRKTGKIGSDKEVEMSNSVWRTCSELCTISTDISRETFWIIRLEEESRRLDFETVSAALLRQSNTIGENGISRSVLR